MRAFASRVCLFRAFLFGLGVACGMPTRADIGSAGFFPPAPSVPKFALSNTDQVTLFVSPRTSTIGAPRTLFVHGCAGNVVLDESGVGNGLLILRYSTSIGGCGQPPVTLTYVPRSAGRLHVRLQVTSGETAAETDIDTVAVSRSQTNIDGMWYDPETSGSGISFHHAANSDAVFGTWFMYGAQPSGGPRWFSLQDLRWQQAGSLLAGTAFQVAVQGLPVCAAGDDCPRLATAVVPVGAVGFTLLDQNNARVEAFDWAGRSVFVSFMKRLPF